MGVAMQSARRAIVATAQMRLWLKRWCGSCRCRCSCGRCCCCLLVVQHMAVMPVTVMRMGVAVGGMHMVMMAMMTEQRRCGARRRRHLVHMKRALLVLRLGATQRRL